MNTKVRAVHTCSWMNHKYKITGITLYTNLKMKRFEVLFVWFSCCNPDCVRTNKNDSLKKHIDANWIELTSVNVT